MPTAVGKGTTSDEDEDDIFGDGASFNDDELDLEGFEIMDGSELY